MLCFVSHCRHNKEKREGPLGTEEVQEARLRLLLQVRREAFGSELNQLKRDKCLGGFLEQHSLNVFLDNEGLLRLREPRQHAGLGYETARPVVLPSEHHLWNC